MGMPNFADGLDYWMMQMMFDGVLRHNGDLTPQGFLLSIVHDTSLGNWFCVRDLVRLMNGNMLLRLHKGLTLRIIGDCYGVCIHLCLVDTLLLEWV